MKKNIILLLCFCLYSFPIALYAQQPTETLPHLAVKSNLLYLATSTPNLAFEVGVGDQLSISLSAGYNAWQMPKDFQIKHYLVSPELRYWTGLRFSKHFWGVHAMYASYNIGPVAMFGSLKEDSYRGDLYGGGISYGYHLLMGKRWGMEFTLGAGYLRLNYKKYRCGACDELLSLDKKNYFGPTKAGISLIYLIN